MKENIGGRVAANFRAANIAESLAIQMMRPFSAVAPVPREEDFGIDLIATMLRRSGKTYNAGSSFAVQIKTITAATFEFKGSGIKWLRELDLPYFPVVMDLRRATASLYTINWHRGAFCLHSAVSAINFTIDGDGLDDFPLGDPLMRWTLEDATHPDFGEWAHSVLQPAIEVEAWNQRYAPMQSIRELVHGDTALFSERGANGLTRDPPRSGLVRHMPPGDSTFIRDTVASMLAPFAGWVTNTGEHDHLSERLLALRENFRSFGIDPDPDNNWDQLAADMKQHVEKCT